MKYLVFLLYVSGFLCTRNDFKNQQNSCTGYYDKVIHSFVYTYVDKMPEYPGGIGKFYSFLAKNIVYDGYSAENYQTKVTIVFIIDTAGTIKNAGIDKKDRKDYSKLELRYLNLLTKTPRWKPGKCNGKNVNVRYMSTINLTPQ